MLGELLPINPKKCFFKCCQVVRFFHMEDGNLIAHYVKIETKNSNSQMWLTILIKLNTIVESMVQDNVRMV
jgi:hypothetical protein